MSRRGGHPGRRGPVFRGRVVDVVDVVPGAQCCACCGSYSNDPECRKCGPPAASRDAGALEPARCAHCGRSSSGRHCGHCGYSRRSSDTGAADYVPLDPDPNVTAKVEGGIAGVLLVGLAILLSQQERLFS